MRSCRKNLKGIILLVLFGLTLFFNNNLYRASAADPFEPNNSFGSATLITKGSYGDLTIDPMDVDYFRIHLNIGENMTAVLWNFTFSSDFTLYDPSQDYIGSYISEGSTRNIHLLGVETAGDYYLRIGSSYSGTSGYNLNITDLTLPDDVYEENDVFGSAAELTKDTAYSNLALNDLDFFKVNLAAEDNLSVQFARTGGVGYLNIWLYAPDTTTILCSVLSVYSSDSGEVFTINATTAGFYYIKVGYEAGGWGNYSLTVGNVLEDIFEENDDFASASPLTKGNTYPDLALYDLDFYKLELVEGGNLSVFLYRNTGIDPFYMTLFAPDQLTSLGTASIGTFSSGEVFLLSVPSTGTYYVKVNGTTNARGSYNLTIHNLAEDIFEQNDDFASSKAILKGNSYTNLALYDLDFYNVALTEGDNLSIVFQWTSFFGGSIALTLFAPDQLTSLSTVSINPISLGEVFVLSVPATGTYYVQVSGTSSARGNYSLTAQDIQDDVFEQNDNFASSGAILKGNSYPNLALYDLDFYKVDLVEGANLSVVLSRNTGNDPFTMTLVAPDQLTSLSTASIGTYSSGEIFLLSAPTTGTYYVKVSGTTSARGNYSLTVKDVLDDVFEQNDDFASSGAILKSNSYPNLALYDLDFYKVDLAEGANLSVVLSRNNGNDYFTMTIFATNQLTSLVNISISSSSSKEVFLLSAPATGTYYVKVNGTTSARGNYTLTVQDVMDDPFEQNDDFASARAILKGNSYPNLELYDDDFYKVGLVVDESLSIKLSLSFMDFTPVYTWLYAPDMNTILSNSSISFMGMYEEVFVLNVTSPGFYYLKVNSTLGTCCTYSLLVGDIQDDAYEQNDNFAEAVLLTKGFYSSIPMRLYDADYYKVELSAGENLSVMIQTSGYDLYNCTLVAPDCVTILGDKGDNFYYPQLLIRSAPTTGPYYIIVKPVSGNVLQYALNISTIFEDGYEENDNPSQAVPIVGLSLPMMCVALDEDWYQVQANASQTLYALCMFGDILAGASLEFYDHDGLTMLPSTFSSITMYPVYSCIVPTTGTIYVRIRCAVGRAVSYIFGVGYITLSSPEDKSYVYNTSGNEIAWTFQDSWIPSGTATVFRDETAIDSKVFSGSDSFTINIDNLSLGQHNLTIILTTMTGIVKQDTVFVSVLPNLAISSPQDFAFTYHTTGHYANWTINATFVGVANYSIYHEAIKVDESLWTPTIPVTYCVDDLSVGTHTFTIYVDDGLGNSTEDTVIIQVNPSINITNPQDITYTFGTTNNNVTWTISALYVGVANYSIYHEALKAGEWFWTSNVSVSFSIDGLSIGTHSFIIFVDDGLGNSTDNTVYVTVANNLVITHSAAEISQVEKSGGKFLTWKITAAISGATSYTIYRNGTAITSGTWVLGQDITFSLDNLPVGTYNITIIASDGLGWTIQDSVAVTITPAPPGGFDIWWIIGIIGASCGLTSIIIVKRRSKRTANFFPEIKEN